VPRTFRIVRHADPVPNVPPCEEKNKNCVNYYTPTENFANPWVETKKGDDKSPFFPWHIPGLIHYDKTMTKNTICSTNSSENEKNANCQLKFNILKPERHTEYFGMRVGNFCKGAPAFLKNKKLI